MKLKEVKLLALRKLDTDNDASDDDKILATTEYKSAKSAHQNLIRKFNVQKQVEQDSELNEILSKQPRDILKSIKSRKTTTSSSIKSLQVGNKIYTEDNISDGFYDNIALQILKLWKK